MASSRSRHRLPLDQYIKVQELTDAEIRQVARDAAREAERTIRRAGVGSIRSAQVALARQQVEMWAAIKDHIMVGIGDAVDAAGELAAFYDEGLLRSAGINPVWWRSSVVAQARAGIPNLRSRKQNGMTLSARVYRNSALSSGQVDRTINAGIALGKSAKEIADSVRQYISPDTPGGASYAAMRLGRTELNNAFHTTQQNSYKNNPFVERVKWSLSGSHGRPDECNEYADSVHNIGWLPGQFDVNDVPNKPHPQCLCYTTPVMMDENEFVKRYHNGEFDDHINVTMGCERIA